LFPTVVALPVSEVALPSNADGIPRTHRMALAAAREAVGKGPAPDAVIVGTTTGGIATTEEAQKALDRDPRRYAYHALETVASLLARELGIKGLVMTVSTACSSSAVAVALARELVRAGLARRVLAGGADALCRLTYHGFRELQLLSPEGTAPFDVRRAGLTLGEGAAFLVIEAEPGSASVEITGSGLSCDGYHATKPHPEGIGAARALREALADAGIGPDAVDYVNLHGTGTIDNDAAEAGVVRKIFGERLPALSSTKGLTGHLLGGAGAIEAVICAVAIDDGIVPANTGLSVPDPALGIAPEAVPRPRAVRTALSSSFGFGGNNACLVLRAAKGPEPGAHPRALPSMRIIASACLSGAGDLDPTWEAFEKGRPSRGLVPDAAFAKDVPAALGRRLRRLSRMGVALASRAHKEGGRADPPDVIAFGTAWGSLADTHAYLQKLFETGEKFSSPIDFVGSVHNSPAGQIALMLGANGPNLTCCSGDRSFEHAVLGALLAARGGPTAALIVAAEAFHDVLSPLLEPGKDGPSDGGAAFAVVIGDDEPGVRVRYLGERTETDELLTLLGGPRAIADRYGAVLIGGADTDRCAHVSRLLSGGPALHPYRALVGGHASASATACALAVRMAKPGGAVLLVTLGRGATALEVTA
jgi:3-oxoacyl-[acyl-carrier-protein] synthase-1/3-oxoacyl-[acyl-carrier-protein] synthase II